MRGSRWLGERSRFGALLGMAAMCTTSSAGRGRGVASWWMLMVRRHSPNVTAHSYLFASTQLNGPTKSLSQIASTGIGRHWKRTEGRPADGCSCPGDIRRTPLGPRSRFTRWGLSQDRFVASWWMLFAGWVGIIHNSPSMGPTPVAPRSGLGFRLRKRIEHKKTSLGATMWLKACAVAHVIEQMFCGWPFLCLFFVRIAFVCFLKKKVYIGRFHGHTVFSREQLPSFTFFIHHFRFFFHGFLFHGFSRFRGVHVFTWLSVHGVVPWPMGRWNYGFVFTPFTVHSFTSIQRLRTIQCLEPYIYRKGIEGVGFPYLFLQFLFCFYVNNTFIFILQTSRYLCNKLNILGYMDIQGTQTNYQPS